MFKTLSVRFVLLFSGVALLISACGAPSSSPAAQVPTGVPTVAATALPVTDTADSAVGQPVTSPVTSTAVITDVADRAPITSTVEISETPEMNSTDAAVLIRDAQVESVTVQILESAPAQVVATVTGILGDGCTQIHEVTQRRTDATFDILVRTTRPADAMCTQVIKSYTESVPLETAGLAAGTYIVSANGVTTTFELP